MEAWFWWYWLLAADTGATAQWSQRDCFFRHKRTLSPGVGEPAAFIVRYTTPSHRAAPLQGLTCFGQQSQFGEYGHGSWTGIYGFIKGWCEWGCAEAAQRKISLWLLFPFRGSRSLTGQRLWDKVTLWRGRAGKRGGVVEGISLQLLVLLPASCRSCWGWRTRGEGHWVCRSRGWHHGIFVFHRTNVTVPPAQNTSQDQTQTEDYQSDQKKNLKVNCWHKWEKENQSDGSRLQSTNKNFTLTQALNETHKTTLLVLPERKTLNFTSKHFYSDRCSIYLTALIKSPNSKWKNVRLHNHSCPLLMWFKLNRWEIKSTVLHLWEHAL